MSDVDEAIRSLIAETISNDARIVSEVAGALGDEFVKTEDFDPDDYVRSDAYDFDEFVSREDLPDFDDYVTQGELSDKVGDLVSEHVTEGLTEYSLRDLMSSYSPGGCETAQTANRLLASWLHGVLSGTLSEPNEMLHQFLAAQMKPLIVEALSEAFQPKPNGASDCVMIRMNGEFDEAGYSKDVGPFDSVALAEAWSMEHARYGQYVRPEHP